MPSLGRAEPPPETTRLRMFRSPSLCVAPQFVAEELLHAEGFTDVQYVQRGGESGPCLRAEIFDVNMAFFAPSSSSWTLVPRSCSLAAFMSAASSCSGATASAPSGTSKVKTSRSGCAAPITSSSRAWRYVGLDPRNDVNWVSIPRRMSQSSLTGRSTPYGLPAGPAELRAKEIGHVVVNSAVDKPWSQYFCCMLAGNREFVRGHPGHETGAPGDPEGDRHLRPRA